MNDRPHPDTADIRMETLLHALAEPTRLAILDLLDRHGETACAEAYGALGLSKANSSHHFRILREAGAIRATMRGRDLYTRIREEDLDRRFPGLINAILAGWRAGKAQR